MIVSLVLIVRLVDKDSRGEALGAWRNPHSHDFYVIYFTFYFYRGNHRVPLDSRGSLEFKLLWKKLV